jgi:hypothetical protein
MNDFELESKLKSVPLPERPEDYWENFPAQVRRQMRRTASGQTMRENRQPQFAWKMSIGFACFIIGLLILGQPLKAASGAIFNKERMFRCELAQLPDHLRVFMQDDHGMNYLIADQQ